MKGIMLTLSKAYACAAFSININDLEMKPSYEILL